MPRPPQVHAAHRPAQCGQGRGSVPSCTARCANTRSTTCPKTARPTACSRRSRPARSSVLISAAAARSAATNKAPHCPRAGLFCPSVSSSGTLWAFHHPWPLGGYRFFRLLTFLRYTPRRHDTPSRRRARLARPSDAWISRPETAIGHRQERTVSGGDQRSRTMSGAAERDAQQGSATATRACHETRPWGKTAAFAMEALPSSRLRSEARTTRTGQRCVGGRHRPTHLTRGLIMTEHPFSTLLRPIGSRSCGGRRSASGRLARGRRTPNR